MDFKITSEEINARTSKHRVLVNGRKLNYSEWINAMGTSDELIFLFNQTLQESPFEAFFWEVKPANLYSMDQVFEFVLVNSKSLKSLQANDASFKKKFRENESVVNFPNLRGDAELIVPLPISKETAYAHLAAFVRSANKNQILAFWKRVVKVYEEKMGL